MSSRAGVVTIVAGALALLVSLVCACLAMASHHFADVKVWLAIAAGAAALGAVLVFAGRRTLRGTVRQA